MKHNFVEFLHIADPVFADPPGKDLIYNIGVSFRDDIEDKIIQEIIKEAKAEGITDVVLLNKPAIIEALKKQTAIKHHHTRIDEVKDKARISVCPSCLGCIITTENEFPKHCTWCGQKIDWSEEE